MESGEAVEFPAPGRSKTVSDEGAQKALGYAPGPATRRARALHEAQHPEASKDRSSFGRGRFRKKGAYCFRLHGPVPDSQSLQHGEVSALGLPEDLLEDTIQGRGQVARFLLREDPTPARPPEPPFMGKGLEEFLDEEGVPRTRRVQSIQKSARNLRPSEHGLDEAGNLR